MPLPSVRVAVAAVAVLILVAPLCGALRSGCQEGKFDCKNGKCISGSHWCDGIDNCGNNADETSCRICLSGSLKCKASNQCVPPGARCNGVTECQDGSDELGCEVVVTERSEVSEQTPALVEEAQGSQVTRSGASSHFLSILLLTVLMITLIR